MPVSPSPSKIGRATPSRANVTVSSQDFAVISSVMSGLTAAPTRDEGGDDSTLVLESLESAAREMSAGTLRQSRPRDRGCGAANRPLYSHALP